MLFIVLRVQTNAQKINLTGVIKNSITKENISAVSVFVKEKNIGTYTDDKGFYKFNNIQLPITLIISSIGYENNEVIVNDASLNNIFLIPTSTLGKEIVVSASRVPEKILESPVSVERVNAANIRNATGVNYYDILNTMKGVDMTTSSLTFKTPTTRGFNTSGNTRFNQLVDGMDNQAPGLNFPVSSLVGLSELDIDNMELLSGASSALYGPGGMNGTLLITSKNPFKYQGLSMSVKEGMMNFDNQERVASYYHNATIRWAKKISEKFAFKFNAELIQAKDWVAADYRNYLRTATNGNIKSGNRETDPNYDGINVYGDETTIDIRSNILDSISATLAPFLQHFIDTLNHGAPIDVSRTGYTENQLINPVTANYKFSGSLHYKLNEKTEAIMAGYWGTGNTVYSASERYSLGNFKMGQYKIELLNPNWNLRAYTTQEDAGNSYNTTVATRLANEAWKPSVYDYENPKGWYIDYTTTYLNYRLNGSNDADAHQAARAFADIGRPSYNSDQFKKIYDSIKVIPISQGGALLVDRSDLYCVDGSYNLSRFTSKFADVLVGGNYKEYSLNSDGTLFADQPGNPIKTAEYGIFAQAARNINPDLKITVSGRYDKNQNFKGRFTPRATAVYKLAEYNHLRFSYQTAYRFPSNQQQWVDLGVGRSNVRLLGCNEYFDSKYNLKTNQLYDLESFMAGANTPYAVSSLKPESLSSFELGYKGLLVGGKLLIDLFGYYGEYQDFITRKLLVQFKDGIPTNMSDTSIKIYSLPLNTTDKVKSYGFGTSLDYRIRKNYAVGINISSDQLTDVPDGFITYFNSPKFRMNMYFANTGLGSKKRLGFNLNYKWQDAINYESDFANDKLPAVNILDAQINYKLPKTKSIIKLGANNLLNQYYYDAVGNPHIGGLYYVSIGYNVY